MGSGVRRSLCRLPSVTFATNKWRSVMFSFFKRGKSKDDGDKKEKSKEKLLFSPFSKRQDSVKKGTSSFFQEQTPTVFDSRFLEFTNSQVPKPITSQENVTPDNAETTQSTKPLSRPATSENFRTKPESRAVLESSLVKDEHDCPPPPCDLPTLAETASGGDNWHTDSASSEVFERAGSNGSSDRAESDSAFKTAPNTPVLAKHLTAVYSDVLIDLVTEQLPLGVKDPLVETKKPLRVGLLESLQEPVLPVGEGQVDSLQLQLEPNVVNTESSIVTKPQALDIARLQRVLDPTAPLGADLDFPSADGEEPSDKEPEGSNSSETGLCEESNLEECCGSDQRQQQPLQEPDSQGEQCEKCANMSQSPGELYDIVEEETSEEEEQSEEEREEDDDDDDDEDSGNVTQPTIEEEYPEDIFK